MNIYVTAIVALIVSYLLGSIPSAYIVGRAFKRIDIRKTGSGNMGAMNAIYAVGLLPGLFVGVSDVGKGALAIYLGTLLCRLSNRSAQELAVRVKSRLDCGDVWIQDFTPVMGVHTGLGLVVVSYSTYKAYD